LPDLVSADTSVVVRLTKTSPNQAAYESARGTAHLAISFQVKPELLSIILPPSRRDRLEALIRDSVALPHSEIADLWYALAAQKRKDLRRRRSSGSDASDADIWILASALEHDLPLLSHDKQQVSLGRALGLRIWTNLPGHRDDNPALR
jgi:predicted nucleic acid-binding protein